MNKEIKFLIDWMRRTKQKNVLLVNNLHNKRDEREKIKDLILIVGSLIAAISSCYAIKSFYEAKELDRPYLTIVERTGILQVSNANRHMILKFTIENTGNLPAQFTTSLDGWPCPTAPRRADNDYVSPNQEIELGQNLMLDCKLPTNNLCDIYENIRFVIYYKMPKQNKFNYYTSLKLKNIPATSDMFQLQTTSTDQYDYLVETCGENEQQEHLVPVWYIDRME